MDIKLMCGSCHDTRESIGRMRGHRKEIRLRGGHSPKKG